MTMTIGDIIGTWIAAGLTLMMFSFIYKDNPLFKLGEHLYLGISVGYYINITYWQVIVPDVYRTVLIEHKFWLLIPAALGLLILLRLVPSVSWLSRMAFAFIIGGSSGLTIPNIIHGILLPQLSQTLVPFVGGAWGLILAIALVLGFCWLLATERAGWLKWLGLFVVLVLAAVSVLLHWTAREDLDQLVILVGVFTVLTFFFFSLEHKKLVGGISRIGLYFIMISFGASFGYTVMARISLLIGRFQFLIYDWLGTVIPALRH